MFPLGHMSKISRSSFPFRVISNMWKCRVTQRGHKLHMLRSRIHRELRLQFFYRLFHFSIHLTFFYLVFLCEDTVMTITTVLLNWFQTLKILDESAKCSWCFNNSVHGNHHTCFEHVVNIKSIFIIFYVCNMFIVSHLNARVQGMD